MSSQITFQPCEFNDVRTNSKYFGCRIYNDYGQTYTNTWDSIPNDDLEVIQKCIEDFKGISDFGIPHPADILFDHITENECGVYVGNKFYEWEEIKHLFEEQEV